MTQWDVAIVGGGPAGLMAAAWASRRGRKTILLDRNRQPGVKILLSGGTRCNLTHATDARGIVEAFGVNGRFLHSALAAFGPQAVVDFFESLGVPTKIEPGGKVFPASDRAMDIRDALVRYVQDSGCTLAMNETLVSLEKGVIEKGVRTILRDRGGGGERTGTASCDEQECEALPRASAVENSSDPFLLATLGGRIEAERVVLATGGQSYPACGTTGDGYRFAAALGHRIVPPHTALVPVTSHASWVLELQGITLPDVSVQVVNAGGGKPLAKSRGAMLFAHFGVTGPVVLDVSHAVSGAADSDSLVLRCDLLPEMSERDLDTALADRCADDGKRRATTLLNPWLPHRVGESLLGQCDIPLERPLAELSKSDRRRLTGAIKRLDIPAAGTMGFRKAELTAGGVALDEVDSRTMESRLVPGLYVVGELLDLNGPVGGYNFQAAFCTGRLAGENV